MLTKRQREVLDTIEQLAKDNGYAPSYREIADELGISALSTVQQHVEALQAKGFLKKSWNHNRSIELVEKPDAPKAVALPLLGVVAAGQPIQAVEQTETLNVPADLLGRGDHFVLRVRGDSMIEDGIHNGDHVICRKAQTAQPGETVVALIGNDQVTLKRFYREGTSVIRLEPANARMEPIRVNAEDCELQGVVVAVLRKY
ncbi:MAG: transcriptional repressor LexA [Deltaproteobacteria bacterium]|nr:transcriptional repressor LexA [Deltaproteobacteria bacterium]